MKHLEKLSYVMISRNRKVSMQFLEEYVIPKIREFSIHIQSTWWPNLVANLSVTYEFIEAYIAEICSFPSSIVQSWGNISSRSDIDIDFIERHLDYINVWAPDVWICLSTNPQISVAFLSKHTEQSPISSEINWVLLFLSNRFDYELSKSKLSTLCAKSRMRQKNLTISKRIDLTKLIKTSMFNEWWHRPDKSGGQNTKRALYRIKKQ